MDRKRTLRSVLIALAAFVLIQGAYFTFTDTPVAAQRATQAQPQSSSGGFLAGQILVQFQPGTRASVQAAIHRTQGATVRRVIRGIDVRVVRVPRGSEQAKVAAYARNPNVLYAELDYLHQPLNDPNDTDFNLKWDLHNDGQLCSAPRADCATQDADIDWQEAYEELADTTLWGSSLPWSTPVRTLPIPTWLANSSLGGTSPAMTLTRATQTATAHTPRALPPR